MKTVPAVRFFWDERYAAKNAVSPFQGLGLTGLIPALGVAQGYAMSNLQGLFRPHENYLSVTQHSRRELACTSHFILRFIRSTRASG